MVWCRCQPFSVKYTVKTLLSFSAYSNSQTRLRGCLYSGIHRIEIMIFCSCCFFFVVPFLSFHFQVPYPMFSAIYSANHPPAFHPHTYIYCVSVYNMHIWLWNAGNGHRPTVNWQPLFILFTSKINLTPAQHNILDTYKMQIHLLFECGEDCFTSPVDTRFHVLFHCLCGFHPVGCLTMISQRSLGSHSLTFLVLHFSLFLLPFNMILSALTSSIHHMCIFEPNYAMHKRFSSCKYYFEHLDYSLRLLSDTRPFERFSYSVRFDEQPFSVMHTTNIRSLTHSSARSHKISCILHYIAIIIIRFAPHSSKNIQQDHVSTHITAPIMHSEHLF